MKHIILYILAWLIGIPILAQNEIPDKYAASISQDDLKGLLTIISSDALEGRETGTRGQKMAAAFIVEEFKRIGLEPIVPTADGICYLQTFKLANYDADGIYLKTDNMHFNLADNILYTGQYSMKEAVSNELVILTEKQISSSLNLEGKVAFVLAFGSTKKQLENLAQKAYGNGANMVIINPFLTSAEFYKYKKSEGRNYARTRYAFEQPADTKSNGYFLVSPEAMSNILQVDHNDVANLLAENISNYLLNKLNEKGLKITYFTSLPTKLIYTENVVGYLEGTDKKDELVVITAHYDHIGKNGDLINNGADDNGSGTSAVIEVAEAYAMAKAAGHGPRRSILFIMVTGEEKGLIGSQYYTNNPLFPIANTVVNLNLDMIGRYDKAHDDDLNFVYLVGSDRLSTELHDLSEKANNTFTHLNLDYTYNDEDHPMKIYYRSDHWNFAKHDVPIIFYFSGVHEDYHQPTDTVDKIEFDLLQKRAQLVFYTSWVIANREQRLVVDKKKMAYELMSK